MELTFVLVELTPDVSERELVLIFVMQSFPQPARLNVFKNDQDTWDYTNPNLSGQGNMQSPTFPSPFFLPLFLSCHCMGWLGFSASGDIAFDHRWMVSSTIHHAAQLSVQRQYSCDAVTIFMHLLAIQQAQSKGMRSNLKGSQPQLKAHACEKPNAPITVAYAGAQFFT